MGGYSSERGISLKSGAVVAHHLKKYGYHVYPIDIDIETWSYTDEEGNQYLIDKNDFSIKIDAEKITFDACYNTVHGTPGEDGKLQGYLELVNIPHSSCNSYVSALTFNKRDTIAILNARDIITAKNIFINDGDEVNTNAVVAKLGLPCFVKANRSGSSFGVTKVYHESELLPALKIAFKEDNEALIESFLDGTEVSVGAYKIGDEVTILPATEIVSDNDFFDYEAKYLGQSKEITPARITEQQYAQLKQIVKHIYNYLNCSGIVRADFIFHNDIPHFVEVNTTPGMSEASLIPQQIKQNGQELSNALAAIIENSIKTHNV